MSFDLWQPWVLIVRRRGGGASLVSRGLRLGTGVALNGFASFAANLGRDLIAMLFRLILASLGRGRPAHFPGGGYARGNQLLLIGILADHLRDGSALFGVDVLLDLLGLGLLLQLADLLLLVVAHLPLGRVGDALAQLFADLILLPPASLARDLSRCRVAFGLLLPVTARGGGGGFGRSVTSTTLA